MNERRADYRMGTLYALVTTLLFSAQEPFSAEAAHQLRSAYYVGVTQFALLLAIPFMLVMAESRRDFIAVFSERRNYAKMAGILAIGVGGLLLYNFGLSGANPIVIAAVLNLSPFWATLVAIMFSGKRIPVSPAVFFPCFAAAFAGAMIIAASQQGGAGDFAWRNLWKDASSRTWLFALPVPVLTALNATLIGEWFGKYKESASLAANFLVSILVVIPVTACLARVSPGPGLSLAMLPAVVLLILGTLASAAAGRVFYQIALSATRNDNGFVSMFFLLVPALAALVTLPMSWFLADLRFFANPAFFTGLALITASLLFFSLRSWKG
jgi:drug/metabolite transporter (DMT)-like permease